MSSRLISRLRNWNLLKRSSTNFDPVYYRQTYPDLRGLSSAAELARHYARHGKAEGRFANEREAEQGRLKRAELLPSGFHWQNYRRLNPDLARVFDQDWQFELHYLEHGRSEGRPFTFADGPQSGDDGLSSPFGHPWLAHLDLPSFNVLNEDWLAGKPEDRHRALSEFEERGRRRLAPLGMRVVFDPVFYREVYSLPASLTDTDLYDDWLSGKSKVERASNESAYLWDFLGERGYPSAFDPAAYVAKLPRKAGAALNHRARVLEHLFEIGFAQGRADHLVNADWSDLLDALATYYLKKGRYPDALRACDLALRVAEPTGRILHLRGDAHRGLGKLPQAVADYRAARLAGSQDASSIVHEVNLLAASSPREALDVADRNAERWSRAAPFRAAHGGAIDAVFHDGAKRARQAYLTGRRSVGDGILDETLATIERSVFAIGQPGRLGPCPDGHVAILANLSLAQCRHYRVEQKQLALEALGIEARMCSMDDPAAFDEMLLGARAAFFYRVPAYPAILRLIATAKHLGIPTFYEVDDLIVDPAHYPGSFASYEGQISHEEHAGLMYGVPLHRHALRMCDWSITSTPPLARELARVSGTESFVVRNGLDARNDLLVRLGAAGRPASDAISIFYGSGTRAHNEDFTQLAGPALISILSRHDDVRLVIAGHLALGPEFAAVAHRVTTIPFTTNLESYWSMVASCDINLAVLQPSLMADCKSEIKWLEAAAGGVPSIVSPMATYREALADGEDVLFAADRAGWESALERLVSDGALRARIGASARAKALAEYSLPALGRQVLHVLDHAARRI